MQKGKIPSCLSPFHSPQSPFLAVSLSPHSLSHFNTVGHSHAAYTLTNTKYSEHIFPLLFVTFCHPFLSIRYTEQVVLPWGIMIA